MSRFCRGVGWSSFARIICTGVWFIELSQKMQKWGRSAHEHKIQRMQSFICIAQLLCCTTNYVNCNDSLQKSCMAFCSRCNCCKHVDPTVSFRNVNFRIRKINPFLDKVKTVLQFDTGSCRKSIKCMLCEIGSGAALKCIGFNQYAPAWIQSAS